MSTFLILAIIGYIIGPILYSVPHLRRWDNILDSFTLAAVGSLALFHLLPNALEHGGVWALVAAIAGIGLPKFFGVLEDKGPWLLMMGMVGHTIVESAAAIAGHHPTLETAVVLHRIPEGMAIFALYHEHPRTSGRGWLAILALIVATIIGVVASPSISALTGEHFPVLEALIAGMLCHVVWQHNHAHDDSHQGAHDHGHGHDHSAHEHSAHEHEHHGHSAHEHHDHSAHEHEHGHSADEHHGHEHHGHEHHGQEHHEHEHHEHAHDPHEEHGHEHHEHGQHEHHGHGHDHHHHDHGSTGGPWIALAALLGLGLVAALVHPSNAGHHHAGNHVFETAFALTAETAPALVAAYFLAGIIQGLTSQKAISWMGRGSTPHQALKGVGFGLPLPICSCGVLPMYETLVRRGVPPAAAVGFLIATPELGVDALLISVPLLGWELTLVRGLAAFAVAMLVAVVIGQMLSDSTPNSQPAPPDLPWATRLRQGLRFGLVELVDHTLPWIIVGLLVAAFAQPLLGHELLLSVPSWVQVPMFALIGIPVYVCASGATPLAAIAIYQGLSPGAALAFLLAGPATNITTFGVLGKLHDKRTAFVFGALVSLSAIGAGWLVNLGSWSLPRLTLDHHHQTTTLQWVCLVTLGILALASLVRQGPRGMVAQIIDPVHEH